MNQSKPLSLSLKMMRPHPTRQPHPIYRPFYLYKKGLCIYIGAKPEGPPAVEKVQSVFVSMKWNEVFCNTFKALKPQTSDIRRQVDFILPSMPMVEACRADDFDFFESFIAAGKLTIEQMHHAARRYYLGKSKSGKAIFWMIDDMFQPLDAHIGSTWISCLLKAREPLLDSWQVQHCLFGLHLLCHTDHTDLTDYNLQANMSQRLSRSVRSVRSVCDYKSISVVESEASAVVLSELFPESIWLAYATTSHLVPDLFAPLEGQTVTIYPRTDPTQSTFLFFEDLVDQTLRHYDLDLHVDTTLEDHATEDQKERCIDILDFIKEPLFDPNSAIIPLE